MLIIKGYFYCYLLFFQEGNLKRYPTPYPDELKNMVKTAQSVAHRLKEDESSDEGKHVDRNHIGLQDVGIKVSFRINQEMLIVKISFYLFLFLLPFPFLFFMLLIRLRVYNLK